MDLNQLYFDHQMSLIRAGRATSCAARAEHETGASDIAVRIGNIQRALGAAAARSWEALAAHGGGSLAISLHRSQGCAA